ncbi:glycosyltransferase, partial [Acinetobacter ursingii]
MNKLLTIIIPVYGVEKYIQEFLDSLFPQIEASIELIFVNDGTQDQSIMILNDSIDKHDINCLILNQSNAGVSSARNNALRVCTGQFVTFLDPDDVVSPKYIEKILDIITNHNDISIIHYNAYMKKENNEIVDMCFVDETS